ncbi:MAG: hypothetical protein ACREN2_00845 [Candidatus Dormibacteria bacterium]
MTLRALAARAMVAVVGAAVAACGQAATHAANSTPADTQPVARSVAFMVRVPAGWSDVTSNGAVVSSVKPDGTLLMLLQGPAPAPVVQGVSDIAPIVLVMQPKQPLTSAQVDTYLQSVKTSGATNVTEPTPTAVARSAATTVTYQSTLSSSLIQTKDVVVSHGGAMFEVELITSAKSFDKLQPTFDRLLTHDWVWVTAD